MKDKMNIFQNNLPRLRKGQMSRHKHFFRSLQLISFVLVFCNPIMMADDSNSFSDAAVVQQQVTITGTVSDIYGEPLPGVSILIKGTSQGTATDANGAFSLSVPDRNATLIFSFVGFARQEIAVGTQNVLNVTLAEDTQLMEEVVVIGYGTVKKSDLTGSVSSISEKTFKDQPVKSLSDILQGRSAGVQVTNRSGMPGGDGALILIRGTTSINKSSAPLYVVDGIFGAGVPNPSDIQSIEILKDASATAIYGSRGANGVVLITTKHGKEGKAQVTLDVQLGVSNIIKKYDLMNPYEYAQALNDVRGSITISQEDMQAYKNGTKGIDWQDLLFQSGHIQDYKLSISGGTQKTKYFISANVLDQTAITIKTKYNRYQFRTNLNTEVAPWFTILTNMNFSSSVAHNNSFDMQGLLTYSPTMEMKNEETGAYNLDPHNSYNLNPYGQRVEAYNDNYSNSLSQNVDLRFKIIDGLTLSIQGALIYTHSPSFSFASKNRTAGQVSSMGNSSGLSLYLQNTNNLTYFKTFGDHQITATGVWEVSQSESKSMSLSGTSLANEYVGYYNYANAATRTGANSYSAYSIVSGLFRAMYTFKNRYMLTGTYRADGSSRFQDDNKWGYFPSAAIAWDVAKEDFFSDQDLFQQLKVRGSYGITGNQGIDIYSTLGMLTATTYGWGTGTRYSGYWEKDFAAPDVSWEKVYQTDIGLDLSMLKGRVNLSIDWYLKNCKDLLLQKTVPGYNGAGSFWVNMGVVKNTGMDITLDAYPVRNNDFSWQSILTAQFQKNKVVELGGEDYLLTSNLSTYGGEFQIIKVGHPIASYYLYEWAGFDDEGCNLFLNQAGEKVRVPVGEDRKTMGQAFPKSVFGWNNMVRWRNWSANIFMNAVIGNNRMNLSRAITAQGGGNNRFTTLRDAYLKSWDMVADKSQAKYSSMKHGDNRRLFQSSFWLEDASFLKINNISVSYDIPRKVLKALDAQVSLSVQNICTFTKYQGMDPEVYSANVGSVGGVDHAAYPVPRSYTLGLVANF